MTQRKWETTDGWEVLCGWDRPLQYFFLDIGRKCRDCDGQGYGQFEGQEETECVQCGGRGREYLFNNLDEPEGDLVDDEGGMTVRQVMRVLDTRLTSYPDGIENGLFSDEANDIGNFVKTYPVQGAAKDAS